MGKTSKLLTILIHPDLVGAPWVKELEESGHLTSFSGQWEFDLIIAPNAWRWAPGMEMMLDAMLKGARAARYPKVASTPTKSKSKPRRADGQAVIGSD